MTITTRDNDRFNALTPGGSSRTRARGTSSRRGLIVAMATMALVMSAHAAPYTAGLHRLEVPYFDTKIDVAIWAPARAPESHIEAGPFSPDAAAGAAIAAGRHPLLLLSHGTGGMNLNHHTLAAALARQGYIVAAPTHPGDNYRDRGMIADPRYWQERPRQLVVTLDALLASARFGGAIDDHRIGAIGHSAGGFAVGALAGLRPDRARLGAHCARSSDPACAYADPSFGVVDPRPQAFVLPADFAPASTVDDPRIGAVAMLAPLAAVFADDARARPQLRLMMIEAEHDEVLTRDDHAARLRRLEPRVEAAVLDGAGHFGFMAPIAPRWRPMLGMIARDPAGFDRAAAQTWLANRLGDWFDRSLGR
ncbi:MAG: hypothetical protein R3E87_14175 [Burkholderiaceae bacterium]